ncbi:MAG: hypothetical protein D6738_00955 [Acidobacteria bacterium]|nr:MAG: hypothetical protein D6738_00955 [Acidobacteriota bacterium]
MSASTSIARRVRPMLLVAPVAALAALALVLGTALAYDTYTNNGDVITNCAKCHGDFRAAGYISKVDGQPWTDDLHDTHRNTMLGGDCDTCHFSNRRVPTYIGKSNGGDGLGAFGCVGCHGRSQDGTGTDTNGWGAGLRQVHFRAGETVCVNCHADSDPANKTPVGENVLPEYYANPGTGHNIPTDPCNPAPTYPENYQASTLGLDNDGDGTFDEADPDCNLTAATPGETSGSGLDALLITSIDTALGVMSISYGPACVATDNRIVYGALADVGVYGYSGQECAIGNTGTYDWSYPADPPSMFFLVVADDGQHEGSYGTDSAGAERPAWGAAPTCPLPQDLTQRCD